MLTIFQISMILIGVWVALMILAIRNRMRYVAKQMGDPMEQGDIWSRRRKKEKNSDFEDDSSEEELDKARQERGKRMREFNKKRKKAVSKAKDRHEFMMKGIQGDNLSSILTESNMDDQGSIGPPDSDWLMLGEKEKKGNINETMKKKVVVKYDDTQATTHGEYLSTLSNRLDPRVNILRQRSNEFKIKDQKPLSWTV